MVFRTDVDAQQALALRGDRARSQHGFQRQGTLFYDNALAGEAFAAALAHRGISTDDLQAAKAAFDSLHRLLAAQRQAREATQRRNRALRELADWMRDF